MKGIVRTAEFCQMTHEALVELENASVQAALGRGSSNE